jgi:hypothetical protein
MFEISSWCFTHKCDSWGIMAYMSRRFLMIADKISRMGEAYYMIDGKTNAGAYRQSIVIAESFGYITAYILNM